MGRQWYQRLLLCLYSPMLAGVLADVPSSVQSAISLPVSAKALLNLLKVLTTGVVVSEVTQDLVDVGVAAKIVGMDFDNFQIVVKRKKNTFNTEQSSPEISEATKKVNLDMDTCEDNLNVSSKDTMDTFEDNYNVGKDTMSMTIENIKEEPENKTKDQNKPEEDQARIQSKTCQCGKTFSSKEKLARHALIHTGVKPFECQHCDRAFNRKDKLNEHIKNKHA